jgi:hypothetical protein
MGGEAGIPMTEVPALVREVFVAMGWIHPKQAEALHMERDEARRDVIKLLAKDEERKERIRVLERHVLTLGAIAAGDPVRKDALEAATKEAERLAERD